MIGEYLRMLPEKVRTALYISLAVAVAVVAGVEVGFAAAEADVPTAVEVAKAVIFYYAGLLGVVASANRPTRGA